MLRRERERKGEARLLALHRLELHIWAPGHEFTEGLSCFWNAMGKNGWLPLKNGKPSAEGFEMDIFAEFAFRDAVNRLVRVWKNP